MPLRQCLPQSLRQTQQTVLNVRKFPIYAGISALSPDAAPLEEPTPMSAKHLRRIPVPSAVSITDSTILDVLIVDAVP